MLYSSKNDAGPTKRCHNVPLVVDVLQAVDFLGMKITEIAQKRNFPKECLFIGIYREESGEFLIPRGSSSLREGDTVFLLTKSQFIKRATEFLARTQ